MDADYDIFEIVLVIQDDWLFDAESYQRTTRDFSLKFKHNKISSH
jgi:hypothetical protein